MNDVTESQAAFAKMQGCGNSFLIIFEPKLSFINWEFCSKLLLSNGFGIGADGFFIIRPANSAHFSISMYNPDGSRMGMCGNGVRCAARFLEKQGLLAELGSTIRFDVEGREIIAEILKNCEVLVHMGSACFEPAVVPIKADSEMIGAAFKLGTQEFFITALSLGNPHCVIFVDDLAAIDLHALGPLIERHELFPERTNVEFVERISPVKLSLKVWERGVGATLACGSGASAALVAGVKLGLCSAEAQVQLPGGTVSVRWCEDTNAVYLSGPARFICSGKLSQEFFEDLKNASSA